MTDHTTNPDFVNWMCLCKDSDRYECERLRHRPNNLDKFPGDYLEGEPCECVCHDRDGDDLIDGDDYDSYYGTT